MVSAGKQAQFFLKDADTHVLNLSAVFSVCVERHGVLAFYADIRAVLQEEALGAGVPANDEFGKQKKCAQLGYAGCYADRKLSVCGYGVGAHGHAAAFRPQVHRRKEYQPAEITGAAAVELNGYFFLLHAEQGAYGKDDVGEFAKAQPVEHDLQAGYRCLLADDGIHADSCADAEKFGRCPCCLCTAYVYKFSFAGGKQLLYGFFCFAGNAHAAGKIIAAAGGNEPQADF